MNTQKTTSIAAASRIIGIGRTRVEQLINMRRLPADFGGKKPKPYIKDVERLAELRCRRTYVSGLDNVDLSNRFAIGFHVAEPDLGGSLLLGGGPNGPGGNGRNLAISELGKMGIHVPGGKELDVTGWWFVDEDNAQAAVATNAIALGITGSLVFEAGEIMGPSYQDSYESKRVFPVRPILGGELEQYLGHVPNVGRGTTYIQL